jgi:choline kinase
MLLIIVYSFQSLRHNPNGRFVVVCGDGEYAVRESTSRIKIYSKNFQVCTAHCPFF